MSSDVVLSMIVCRDFSALNVNGGGSGPSTEAVFHSHRRTFMTSGGKYRTRCKVHREREPTLVVHACQAWRISDNTRRTMFPMTKSEAQHVLGGSSVDTSFNT